MFTVTPVQGFILQSRKVKDMYESSILLSHIIENVINGLQSNFTGRFKLIFPAKEVKTKPNRMLCKINCENVKEVGNMCKQYALECISKRINYVLESIGKEKDTNFSNEFETQVNNYFNYYWAAEEFTEEISIYRDKYLELEKLMGAIKNIKNFNQPGKNQEGEAGRKCSLCGERDALIYKPKPESVYPAYLNKSAKIDYKGNLIDINEGLCAVCSIKRLYSTKKEKYSTTAEIALMDTIFKIDNDTILEPYRKIFNSNFDEQLYFKENLSNDYFDKNGISRKYLDTALSLYSNIEKQGKLVKAKFSKYYAIIMFDGDNMGKWLSGDSNFLKGDVDLEKFHNVFSRKLGEFGNNLYNDENLKFPKAKIIYSGGDDFLGFINLTHLFDTLILLHKQFREKVSKDDELLNFKNESKCALTLSAGITIAHYKAPLNMVLSNVRKSEKQAKGTDEDVNKKDRFNISVLKHSGEYLEFRYKWESITNAEVFSMCNVLKQISVTLKNNYFSNNFIKNLQKELAIFKEIKYNDEQNLSDIVEIEIKRLVKRSELKSNDIKKTKFEDLLKNVVVLYRNSENLENFLHTLEAIDFIRKEIN